MGCDIHAHIEVLIDGRWHHYSKVACDRSYQLFERMAGVRGSVSNAICAPRGFVTDPSLITEIEWEHGSDAHTPSWLTADELEGLCDWLDKERFSERPIENEVEYTRRYGFGFLDGSAFNDVTAYADVISDVRLVFWFDN